MSGIVFGGLLGAAAAMYLSRSNRTFSLAGMSSAGQALDNIVEKARSRMMEPDKRSYYGEGTSNSTSTTDRTSGGLERVEGIVKSDPALQSQVNEILGDSRDTSTTR